MIQDIAPHRLDNQYHTGRTPREGDFLMIRSGQAIIARKTGNRLELPQVPSCAPWSSQYRACSPLLLP